MLAIAGLIFLIVFLALPALQKSQRDTQRKNDVGRLISAVQSFQGNNRGNLPADMGGPATMPDLFGTEASPSTYLNDFADPTGGWYTSNVQTSGVPSDATGGSAPTNVTDGRIWVYPGVDCTGADRGSRTVSVVVSLENGGEYCQNN